MSLYVKDNGGDFENPETGLQHAVCSHVTDLGLIDGQFGPKEKVMVSFELAQKMKDGRPFMVSQEFTASLNEKSNLCKTLESWRGKKFTADELKGFDIERLIGANCYLNLGINEKGYPRILGVSPSPKGTAPIKPVGQPLPAWIQKKAEAGRAMRDANVGSAPAPQQQAPTDDLPF